MSLPQSAMDVTTDYGRHMKDLLTPYLGAVTGRGKGPHETPEVSPLLNFRVVGNSSWPPKKLRLSLCLTVLRQNISLVGGRQTQSLPHIRCLQQQEQQQQLGLEAQTYPYMVFLIHHTRCLQPVVLEARMTQVQSNKSGEHSLNISCWKHK